MSRPIKLPTLLVITNNPSIRFWLKKQLDKQFFVLSAEQGEEALQSLNTRLDFIILDSELEESDPLELCTEISKTTLKAAVPILLITGKLKKSYRKKAKDCGVTDFLSDQLDPDELKLKIEEGLKAASLRQKTEDVGLSISKISRSKNDPSH